MKPLIFRLLVVVVLFLFLAASAAFACGSDRWEVKVLRDPQAGQVNFNPLAKTVCYLGMLKDGPNMAKGGRSREEMQVYIVSGVLVQYRLESDEDIHLVVHSNGCSIIMEMPAPNCTRGSLHRSDMTRARSALIQKFGAATRRWRYVGRDVVVSGVLFFDSPHKQTGHAKNYVELHPVLSFT